MNLHVLKIDWKEVTINAMLAESIVVDSLWA